MGASDDSCGRVSQLSRGTYNLLGPHRPTPASAGAAIDYVFEHQREQRQSPINRVLCAAIRGEAGARGPHVWLSPLLAVQWFFGLEEVAASHLFLDALAGTTTIGEVSARIEAVRKGMTIRDRSAMPI